MGNSGTEYSPPSPVLTVRVRPVPVFLMVTVAPETAKPVESVTVPKIVPRNVCACTAPPDAAIISAARNMHTTPPSLRIDLFIEFSLNSCEIMTPPGKSFFGSPRRTERHHSCEYEYSTRGFQKASRKVRISCAYC